MKLHEAYIYKCSIKFPSPNVTPDRSARPVNAVRTGTAAQMMNKVNWRRTKNNDSTFVTKFLLPNHSL